MWNGTMTSAVLNRVRDSSVRELCASGHGVSNTRLIAKFGNELNIPQPVQGKIKLWRDGKALHTVSPDETDELYAAQFDVQVQREWFLCFSISKAEPSEDSFGCLIDDPKFKLPSKYSQHSNYMWSSGIEINSSQIEAVRLWRIKTLTDLSSRKGAET